MQFSACIDFLALPVIGDKMVAMHVGDGDVLREVAKKKPNQKRRQAQRQRQL
jgi:hypothetical protein